MQHSIPVIRPRPEHGISRKNIDPDALTVLYRLSRCGYIAYLVGGGVRDLLLGRQPKDFDVGTDAHPRQIRSLFRNCYLVGRRFRLAHIRFGNKVIETSTFRRQPPPRDPGEEARDGLLQRRDNTFGTPQEDALRRDFTVNALFYDIRTFRVIDYVDGLADLRQGIIRCIGDPDVRFREDPVRMIRAARFASRLGFTIEASTFQAIRRHRGEIRKASPPRMLEEIGRLFLFRSAEAAFRLLHECGLLEAFLPELTEYLESREGHSHTLWRHLAGLDRRQGSESPSPCLAFAALFCAPFHRAMEARGRGAAPPHRVAADLLGPVMDRFKMPRRMGCDLVWLLGNQPRFEWDARRASGRFASHPLFPQALTLREIHLEAADGNLAGIESWKRRLHRPGGTDNRCPAP